MTSADFCRLCFNTRSRLCLRLTQISPGKNANLRPMYLPHLPPCAPDSGRASFCFANSPAHNGLICGFCSSGQDFAAGFLQIPSRDGHPCLWLTLLAVKRVADSHRQVSAHAGRTKTVNGPKPVNRATKKILPDWNYVCLVIRQPVNRNPQYRKDHQSRTTRYVPVTVWATPKKSRNVPLNSPSSTSPTFAGAVVTLVVNPTGG